MTARTSTVAWVTAVEQTALATGLRSPSEGVSSH